MTIQELATSAGVTTRTIRYYVEQGVLPPPGRGRPAEYTEEHRRILEVIRRLKEQYLPLEEIRAIVGRLSPGELETFLQDTYKPAPTGAELSPAADYIAGVLGRGALREQLKQQAPEPQPAQAAPPAPMPFSALRASAPAQIPYAASPSGAMGGAAPAARAESAAAMGGEQVAAQPPEQTWQRVILAPGVELQYEAQVGAKQKSAISRLVAAAKRIMAGDTAGTEEQE